MFRGHLDSARAIKHVGGALVSGGDDGLLLAWDSKDKSFLAARHHSGPVFALTSDEQGVIYSGGLEGAVVSSSFREGQWQRLHTVPADKNSEPVWDLSCKGPLLLVTAADRKLRLY